MAILEVQLPLRPHFEDKTHQGLVMNAVAIRRGITC